jgi:hypothetical protein
VLAVLEPAQRRQARHFAEAQRAAFQIIDGRGEVAHARRIDDAAAAVAVIQARCGGGMPAFLLAHQAADRDVTGVGGHQARERRLADAGLSDENGGLLAQCIAQRGQGQGGGDRACRQAQYRISQRDIRIKCGTQRIAFGQLALVEHDQRLEAGAFGCAQVAVDHEQVGRGQRRQDHRQLAEVRGQGLAPATQGAAPEKSVARQRCRYQQFVAFRVARDAIAAHDFDMPAERARHAALAALVREQQVATEHGDDFSDHGIFVSSRSCNLRQVFIECHRALCETERGMRAAS